MVDPLPLQLGIPGGPELLVILLIAVLLFGANKIPKLARSTGEAMGEFQKGREEVEQELQEMKEGPSTDSGTSVDTGTTTDAGTEADQEFEISDAETSEETEQN
ncbi:twin-arginine translocase TatA/TatE family subunit [Natronomonas marina]|jgi:sec-independent protein translocase protein TatA|uniref:twin-arginine translocase TatA/TatE family subunit n=1 Tax=Natronomonas marina TaxID=2961939 RepID=UPI0020C98222|nr:twin-arginine translocase TatA/TatE family subunit [Natronomonas marina]